MTVEQLKEELDIAHERIRQLEQELQGRVMGVPMAFKLTYKEEQIFKVLLSRSLVSKQSFMAACYVDHFVCDRIIDVFICKIRRKLERFDMKINTAWGKGYYISSEDKATVKKMLEAERMDDARVNR